jgi:murein DD-endopeptidase MepM/ murein hydrolase activator NlpD
MRATVKKGQKIYKGQILGQVGETGRTTGPNLHFEVAVAGKITDPRKHLSKITEIVGDDRSAINNG